MVAGRDIILKLIEQRPDGAQWKHNFVVGHMDCKAGGGCTKKGLCLSLGARAVRRNSGRRATVHAIGLL
jgi:hypothetical protein